MLLNIKEITLHTIVFCTHYTTAGIVQPAGYYSGDAMTDAYSEQGLFVPKEIDLDY